MILQDFQTLQGSALIMYIDDLLVASTTSAACKTDTLALLIYLAEKGLKVSPKKLQFCQNKVTYLGHAISKKGREVLRTRLPECLRSVTAAALLVEKAQALTLGHQTFLHVPHSVEAILSVHKTQHLSVRRQTSYEQALLSNPAISLGRCDLLNPATLLPYSDSEEIEHDCLEVIDQDMRPHPDMKDTPISNPDLIFFTDSSCYQDANGTLHSSYVVVSPASIVEAYLLPGVRSAQTAELVALTRAATLASGSSVNIFTDSKYAFGICHATGRLWKQRGFLTSTGSSVSHGHFIAALLDAIQLPSEIAVVHCKAHTGQSDFVSIGNASADHAAKAASALCPFQLLSTSELVPLDASVLKNTQKCAPMDEVQLWEQEQ
ncbi:uncharacterized protein LOC123017628 [Varanus komodoensis]|uniref:uncharacterized protein LOC123017628 n=1 Tax=Varanus komodoensis TaxID=61221 RepID=UPI001CF76F6A|nr:uncharacterized protein LOC123017628 [Varanus komodoensis]